MRALTDFLIARHRLVLLAVVGILALGYVSYRDTPAASTPDIVIPVIMVQTPWPGAAVGTVEDQVTIPIERELEDLDRLERIRSYSWTGFSFVILEFEAGVDLDKAMREVRDGVDEARGELPPDVETPRIADIAFEDFPILILSLTGDQSAVSLRRTAEGLQSELESLPGVTTVSLFGAPEQAVIVEPDLAALRAVGLTLSELSGQIREANLDLPIGSVSPGGSEVQLSYRGKPSSVQEIADLEIRGARGRFRLHEVAAVWLGPKEISTYSRQDGLDSVSLVVRKTTGENTIRVGEAVIARVERYCGAAAAAGLAEGTLSCLSPGGSYQVTMVGDQMTGIRDRLGGMVKNFGQGFLLVVIVLVFFMGLRNSLLIALGIPLSVGFAMILMRAFGFSFNNVTLFGIILVLGMIVDDDIIVVENIYRHQENGESPEQASRKGIHEVSVPITAAIFTTIAAFTPLMFLSDTMGQFMKYIPYMVIFSLVGAFLVGHFILPSLSRLWLRVRREASVKRATLWRDRHAALLRRWGRRPGLVVLAAVLVFAGSLSLFGRLPSEFFPDVPNVLFVLNIRAPTGTAVEATDKIARRAEEIFIAHSDTIAFFTTSVGSAGENVLGATISGGGGSAFARIQGEFRREFRRQSPALSDGLLEELRQIPGATFDFEQITDGPPGGNAIILRAFGDDYGTLRDYTGEIDAMMRNLPYLSEVNWGYAPANPEAQVTLRAGRAAALGVSPQAVALEARAAFDGSLAHEITLPGEREEVDVVVRSPLGASGEIGNLSLLSVRSRSGALVPFDAVARLSRQQAPSSLTRYDGKPSLSVSAMVKRGSGMDADEALAALRTEVAKHPLPQGVEISWGGENEQRSTGQEEMLVAFMVALGLVFLIMVSVFDSFRQAMVVMSAVPFAVIGVAVGLTVTGNAMGFMALMAIVALSGIVVNDSIVLIHRVNNLRGQGHSLLEAVAQGASQRLRPILMTSVTTIVAFLPLAVSPINIWRAVTGQPLLDMGSQTEFWGPLSISIMFGLAFATVLILLVVPCLYLLVESPKERAKKAAEA
ncbi:efflux RND transporter permease subunit [bacterium]|nr:efflux RND transporter permease subunit [bacterium]